VRRISTTYNGIREMRGEFTQFDPAGARSTGQFFLTKPGRVRFQYAAPSPVEVIGDGRHLAVRDKRLNTQDIYLIEQTPLRHLLSANLDLAAQTRIISMQTEGDLITLALEERGAMVEGQITLFFDAGDLSIRQWTTTDATGQETAVRVRNVVVNQRNDPQLFLVDQSVGR
jgi:outer membrane lipoprotein-sorting protein